MENSPLGRVDADGRGWECTTVTVSTTSEVNRAITSTPIKSCKWTYQPTAFDLQRIGQVVRDTVQQTTHAIKDYLSAPRSPGCMTAATNAGAGAGMATGVAIGAYAGGPEGAMLLGGAGFLGGGGLGWAVGMNSCMTNNGSGSGGSSEESTTIHGAERLKERRLSPEEIANIKTGERFIQEDGATAYVKKVGRGRFNVLVEGNQGIITALRNLSRDEVTALARNYGWH